MKLARARTSQGMNLAEPEYQGASRGNPQQLLQSLLHLRQRIRNLETASGGANINLHSPARNAEPPPFAGLKVTGESGSGKLVVQLTNPQYQVKARNTPATPVYHHLEISDTAHFANPIALPVTSQNYMEITRPAGTKNYVRLRSSFDGKTKNSPQFSGLVRS